MTISELRLERNLTRAAFAQSIGVALSTLAGYETGRVRPNAGVLAKVAEVYGVQVEAAAEERQGARAAAGKAAPKARKSRPAKKRGEPQIIIQSPLGGEITPFAILAKVGPVDKVYIRVDKNKAYWVRGNETGSVDLW